MLELLKQKAGYFLSIFFCLFIFWFENHSNLSENLISSYLIINAVLLIASYCCYKKTWAKSFKLLWLYTAVALFILVIGQSLSMFFAYSTLFKDFTILLAWLFAILAIETNPHLSDTPQNQFTIGRVTTIIFIIAMFTYLVMIPKQENELFEIDNYQIQIFNAVFSLFISYRVYESWQLSSTTLWKQFYQLLAITSVSFSFANVLDLLFPTSEQMIGLFCLIPVLALLSLVVFVIRHCKEFSANEKRYSVEMYLIIQIVFFTGLHLTIETFRNVAERAFQLESLLFGLWITGTLSFFIFLIRKSKQQQSANETAMTNLEEALLRNNDQINKLTDSLVYSEEKAIVASSNNAILTVSPEGIILSANPAAILMFQYLEQELIGQTIAALFDDEDELHFFFNYQSNVYALERKKSGISKESQCVRADGHTFPSQVEMQWAERKGSPLIVITFINLTSRKLAEQQTLEQKDAFLANVSHEFRTPLTLINGVIDKFIESAESKAKVEDLITAKRNSLRLVRMVEQLLELSKMQESPSLSTAIFELSHLLQMPLDSFRQLCEQQSLSFNSNIPSSLFLECDAEAFEKIIFNLLANAVKYTPKDGKITVNAYHNDNDILIDIIDTGIGISSACQHTIFNRFERANEPTQETQFGVGIGLSLVNELVKAHNWRISLISEPNKGSKFTLHIPAATNSNNAQIATTSISHQEISSLLFDDKLVKQKLIKPEDKRVVLLIEDNKDMQQHVQELLDTQHHCIAADNGESGIALAVEYIPDIIVCDIMLTGIDGFDVLRFIKNHEATSHIPVILLTARSDLESRLKGLGLKADEYLGKPFNRKELLTRIDSLIENRERLKEVYINKYMDAQQKQRKQLSHQHIATLTESEEPEKSADDSFLEKLEQFVAKHYTDPQLEITEIASHLAMSERQLQRKIRMLLGSTPNNYLKEFRLSKATEELAIGKPIGHIALDVGFSSQTYFGRCFKEKYQMTPKQFQAGRETE